jgi:hypothetical protein
MIKTTTHLEGHVALTHRAIDMASCVTMPCDSRQKVRPMRARAAAKDSEG